MAAVINPFKRAVCESYHPVIDRSSGAFQDYLNKVGQLSAPWSTTLISWAYKREFNEPGPYTCNIYRSASASTKLVDATLVATTTDQPWAYDYYPQSNPFDSAIYYKVTLSYPGLVTPWETDWFSTATGWNRRDWLIAREIVRKENLLLQKRGGTRGWLFKRRNRGQACPRCLDPATGQVIDPKCLVCYGTGVNYGYHDPVELWALRNPSARETKLVPGEGVVVANLETMRCLAWASPEVGDIWVQDREDACYRIQAGIASVAMVRGLELVLNVPIKLLPSTDVAYSLPTINLSHNLYQ